jgi:large subunit ribosomal protein L15
MNLTDLTPGAGATKRRKKVGRGPGSGHGKTSTRGHKGDKSRGSVRPGFEGGQTPLHRRLPKRRGVGVGLSSRGFNSGEHKTHYEIVNLGVLEARFEAGATVDRAILTKMGIIRGTQNVLLKVLSEGELTKPLNITADKFSASAEELIRAAGGQANVVSDLAA